MKLLEACVDSVESAVAAQRGGADRLELCANLIIGGTSPSPALFERVRANADLPVRVLLRPRFGDFFYTDEEFEVLKAETRQFAALGAEGVVVGILTPDGALDAPRLAQLLSLAPGMKNTLHRAFDLCRDPFEALETAVELGFSTILSSGQAENVRAGAALLGELVKRAAGRIEIMPGGGVDAQAIAELSPSIPAEAWHMSGKVTLPSGMAFRREGVPMGLPGLSEYSIFRTDESRVRAAASLKES